MTEKKPRSGQAANPRKRADEAVREGLAGLAGHGPPPTLGDGNGI